MAINTDRVLNTLNRAQAELTKSMSRISSGVAVQKPSDDPLAYAQSLGVTATISRNSVQMNALEAQNTKLSGYENTAMSLNESLVEVQDLMIQAQSPAVQGNDLSNIAKVIASQLESTTARTTELVAAGQMTQAQADAIQAVVRAPLDSLLAGQKPSTTQRADLANAMEDNLVYVTKLGGQQRANTQTIAHLGNQNTIQEGYRSELIDTNMAAESIRFNALNTQISATYATIAKVGSKSLFDYIG